MSKFIEVTGQSDNVVYIIDIEGCIVYPDENGCLIANKQGSGKVKESYEWMIFQLQVIRSPLTETLK